MIRHSKACGFTLVEISIVMIIIGLLIGGTFGGMKLIENMQVNRTVQDLKAIESAALTFKDTYGRLPGDMPNTAARLPNCTVAPCSTGGNGNRIIGVNASHYTTITSASEEFTFWHHLRAADLLSSDIKNVTDLNFGEGQPSSPIGGGYRLTYYNLPFVSGTTYPFRGSWIIQTVSRSETSVSPVSWEIPCRLIEGVDRKIDDGAVYEGPLQGWGCAAVIGTPISASLYTPTSNGVLLYDLRGF